MFANNGPVGAARTLKGYIAANGVNYFPEPCRMALAALIDMTRVEAIILGTERLFAALVELEGLPDRPAALAALGEAAQQVGLHSFGGDPERGYALMTWAAAELDAGAVTVPPVDPAYSFLTA